VEKKIAFKNRDNKNVRVSMKNEKMSSPMLITNVCFKSNVGTDVSKNNIP
jgi:hypothetical protein